MAPSTLAALVAVAADAVLTCLLGLPGNENAQSAYAVVGETNDGGLSLIRLRPITEAQVLEALRSAPRPCGDRMARLVHFPSTA